MASPVSFETKRTSSLVTSSLVGTLRAFPRCLLDLARRVPSSVPQSAARGGGRRPGRRGPAKAI